MIVDAKMDIHALQGKQKRDISATNQNFEQVLGVMDTVILVIEQHDDKIKSVSAQVEAKND
jgi:hypothetical protein